jgi:hypothetical protein
MPTSPSLPFHTSRPVGTLSCKTPARASATAPEATVASDDWVYCHFDVPANQERGESELIVVANGIPSSPVRIDVGRDKE